jgi:hypothetical protein
VAGQRAGALRGGDPVVLAGIFSGMVQAYQSHDPASVGEPGVVGLVRLHHAGEDPGMVQAYQSHDPASVGEPGVERLALADFHALLEGAFAP